MTINTVQFSQSKISSNIHVKYKKSTQRSMYSHNHTLRQTHIIDKNIHYIIIILTK